jgi:tRNA A-37 threonylcarbamoyl transferase component Bud32
MATPTLTPAQRDRVDELYDRALTEPDRAAVLAACDDAAVRAEVESLLRCTPNAGAVLAAAIGGAAEQFAAAGDSMIGRRLGPYRLTKLLGEGGMGAVYLAERDDAEFRREVAIKVLHHGLGSPQAIARFRDERQILAGLEHPGIVRLLDGGTHDGAPYLVMENVAGAAITAFARTLSIRDRIALVRKVCDALAYAHGKHVVHRDIKPSNVLVTAGGQPKLLDFGIAKLVGTDDDREAKTRTGVALLTPAYASPEQARGEPVTTATDIYSIGAVLYELLAGKPPLDPRGNALEVVRAITEEEPALPSVIARDARALGGDLDNIVLKTLRKNPAERYRSIEELAADLGRYLDGLAVHARRTPLLVRGGKLVRRHRGKMLVGALGISLAVTLWIALRPGVGTSQPSGADRLVGVWTDSIRLGLRARFAATPGPDIPGGWIAIERELDTYATRLGELWDDAIASPDRERDPLLYAQRLACLENGFIALKGIVESTATAEIGPFVKGYAGGFAMPFLEDCTQVSVLRAQIPAPPAEQRDEVARLQRQINLGRDKARRAANAGLDDEYEEGLALLADAGTKLDALGSPVAAEAWGFHAQYLVFRGLDPRFHDRCVAALDQAIANAERHRHEQRLVYALGLELLFDAEHGNWTSIDHTIERGLQALERAGQPFGPRHNFAIERAKVEIARRRFAKALQILDEDQARAAAFADKLAGLYGVGNNSYLPHRMTALYGLGRLDEAVLVQQQQVATAVAMLGEAHMQTVRSRDDLSRMLARAGRVRDALDQNSRADRDYERLGRPGSFLIGLRIHALSYALELGLSDRVEAAGTALHRIGLDWHAIGNQALELGFVEASELALARATAELPATAELDRIDVEDTRAAIAFARGDLAAATAGGTKVLASPHARTYFPPSPWLAQYELASRGRLDEALARVADYDAAAQAKPESRRVALIGRALLQFAARRWQSAIDDFRAAGKLSPTNRDFLGVVLLTYLGTTLVESGQLAEATPSLVHVVQIVDELDGFHVFAPLAQLSLARAMWDTGGDRAEARRLAERARDGYTRLGQHRETERQAAIRWLETHSLP